MRIIGGHKKGILLHAPAGLPVRPTTDRAKESLFNILQNNFDLEELSVLDLFAGTGNISYEFASRGAIAVLSIDQDNGCVKFMKETARKLDFTAMEVRRQDVFAFLKNCEEQFDIIFGDAPYALSRIAEIPGLVFEKNLLKPGAWLILEHATLMSLSHLPNFFEERKYGQSTFSFFKST
ncbi:MAG: 16S rRNA (guanine(966)-N(2))-methyltransferase RsmD [Bacteroidetes bacterium B1(2017)]|nr:MAG: 16S rRNA (guanine(966)-N(2))-methyltransferase RsmD [Bacteroidetes bacterium B1(2017)]